MTLPTERTRAVIQTRDFMLDLITPSKTPKVPRAVRVRALRCLRHYPGAYEFDRLHKLAPESWGRPE
ncbi:MAG: hypothetical protein NUV51_11690 [Sulfuricaulis sp.]|nr:hypothetical protein [Sulfuricaulis sp.]